MTHRPHFKHLTLLILLTLIPLARTQEEEEAPITVGSEVTAVQEGQTAEIQCSTTQNEILLWFVGTNATADKEVPESGQPSPRVFANVTTGLLTIKAALLNDSGEYLCRTLSGSHNVTAELHVYVMPSYLTEGLIVLGIIAALLLIFTICFLYTVVRSRKQARLSKARCKAKMAKPDPEPQTRPVTVTVL